jgi:hypothetical protein
MPLDLSAGYGGMDVQQGGVQLLEGLEPPLVAVEREGEVVRAKWRHGAQSTDGELAADWSATVVPSEASPLIGHCARLAGQLKLTDEKGRLGPSIWA